MGEPAVGSIPLTRRFVQASATVQARIVSRTRRVPSRYENSGMPVPSVTVVHPSLALLLAVCSRADINASRANSGVGKSRSHCPNSFLSRVQAGSLSIRPENT